MGYLAPFDQDAGRIGSVDHCYQSNTDGDCGACFGLEHFAAIVAEGEGFTQLIDTPEVEADFRLIASRHGFSTTE